MMLRLIVWLMLIDMMALIVISAIVLFAWAAWQFLTVGTP